MTTSPPAWLPVKDEAKDPFKENAARLFGLRRTVTKRARSASAEQFGQTNLPPVGVA
jgi:hypothetical protein